MSYRSIISLMPKTPPIPQMVTSGLQLYLDTNKPASYSGSGTSWNDISGNSNNAVLVGAPTYSPSEGGQLIFNGSSTYATIANSISLTQATVGAWIKRNGSQTIYTTILGSRSSDVCGLLFTSSNNIGVIWNNTIWYWATGLVVPDNTWCYVAVSLTASETTVYLCQTSGITSATLAYVAAPATLNAMRVASDSPSYPRIFTGSIAQIHLYNRGLNLSEITQNFNAARGIFSI